MKIITGEVDSGKSTRFLCSYNEALNQTIALCSCKLYDSKGAIVGYDLVLLPHKVRLPFIILKECVDIADNYYSQGRFAFSKEAFIAADRYVQSFPNSTPLWIDEVGKLELKGLGYDSLLRNAQKDLREIVIVVRTNLLCEVIDNYSIKDYELL
ncbi:MAG: nucleoside-triphosphatase [Bacteroidales bacterium]